jgi:hypothetical protein
VKLGYYRSILLIYGLNSDFISLYIIKIYEKYLKIYEETAKHIFFNLCVFDHGKKDYNNSGSPCGGSGPSLFTYGCSR